MKLIKLLLAILTITAGINITAGPPLTNETIKYPIVITANCIFTLLSGGLAYMFLMGKEESNPEHDLPSALTSWRTIHKLGSQRSQKSLDGTKEITSQLNNCYRKFAMALGMGLSLTAATGIYAYLTTQGIMGGIQSITGH